MPCLVPLARSNNCCTCNPGESNISFDCTRKYLWNLCCPRWNDHHTKGTGVTVTSAGDVEENDNSFTLPDLSIYKMSATAITATIATGAVFTRTGSIGLAPPLAALLAARVVVTLEGNGDSDAQFIFYSDTTVGISASASIVPTNGVKAKNMFCIAGTAESHHFRCRYSMEGGLSSR